MPAQRKTCPDCDRTLTAIQIIDKKGVGITPHGVLEYAVSEAKRNKWTGQFPVEGSLHAYMCDGCGRALLYAGAND